MNESKARYISHLQSKSSQFCCIFACLGVKCGNLIHLQKLPECFDELQYMQFLFFLLFQDYHLFIISTLNFYNLNFLCLFSVNVNSLVLDFYKHSNFDNQVVGSLVRAPTA